MEIVILVVALVFELAIAVYSIVTKQRSSKIKSWTRIVMFIGFIMLSLGKVIVWEYTWGLFASLLFLLAFKEMVALLRKQAHTASQSFFYGMEIPSVSTYRSHYPRSCFTFSTV